MLTALWADTDSYACCFTTAHSHLASRGGTLTFSMLDVLAGDTGPHVRELLNEGLLGEGVNKVSDAVTQRRQRGSPRRHGDHAEDGRTLPDLHL